MRLNAPPTQHNELLYHALRFLDQHTDELKSILNDKLSAHEAKEMIDESIGLGVC